MSANRCHRSHSCAAQNGEGARNERRRRSLFAYAVLLAVASVTYLLDLSPESWTLWMVWIVGFIGLAGLIAAWAERKLAQVALLLIATLLSLLIAEIVLRRTVYQAIEYEDLFQFDERLGWRFAPEEKGSVVSNDYRQHVEVNAAGFRDIDHGDEASGETVVAVLGDSFTSNLGVDWDACFTSLLERELGPGYSVWNFGVNGYGQVQELILLDQVLEVARPELVLLVVYARNDLDDNIGRFDSIRRYQRPTARLGEDGALEIVTSFDRPTEDMRTKTLYERIRSTALDRLIRDAILPAQHMVVEPNRVPPELRYARVPLEAEERAALEVMSALLREFDRRTRAADVALGLVVAPGMVRVYDHRWQSVLDRHAKSDTPYDPDQIHRLLAEDSAQADRIHLDLVDSLQEAANNGAELYYPSEQHWNRAGNAVVATTIAQWLHQSGLLTIGSP